MKRVIWRDESRVIPNYGEAHPGSSIPLPDEMAQAFINAGQAEPDAPPLKKKLTQED